MGPGKHSPHLKESQLEGGLGCSLSGEEALKVRQEVGWCTESFLWTQTQGSWSELQVTTLSQELPFTAFIFCFRVVSSIQDLSLINFPSLPIVSNIFLNKPEFV